jgi:hypothetical protein
MPLYAITLLDENDLVREERMVEFEHDDAAIDYAGSIDHPHAIHVREGDRLVVKFAPEPIDDR